MQKINFLHVRLKNIFVGRECVKLREKLFPDPNAHLEAWCAQGRRAVIVLGHQETQHWLQNVSVFVIYYIEPEYNFVDHIQINWDSWDIFY